MLVKIIAVGHSPAIWKNVFHHLRQRLPQVPFSAGIFSTPEEQEFLLTEFLPHHWRREAPDFVFTEAGSPGPLARRLALLAQLRRVKTPVLAEPVLVLSTIEGGLKQLVQGRLPVRVHLDNRAGLHLADPGLIVRTFPGDFPRVRVNDHVTKLRLRERGGKLRELAPGSLPAGSLVGFSELEAVVHEGEALGPVEWLRKTLRAERVRLPAGTCQGLIREARGLFLFPGVPVGRVRGLTLGEVTFSHLLDLGLMTEASPHFEALVQAVRKAGTRQTQLWKSLTARLRDAEAKADFPVACGTDVELLGRTLSALLAARGFRVAAPLADPARARFEEPTLVVALPGWDAAAVPAQVEEPHLLAPGPELAARLAPLDDLLAWQRLRWAPEVAEGDPLTPEAFEKQARLLLGRRGKVRGGLEMAGKRGLLVRQEADVLASALAKLDELLEAEDTLLVWSGTLPESARQVLVFSHDQEEAGAVLQELPGIAKKRWFDLSPFTAPEAIQNLSLDGVRHYLDGGVMVITAASRERLQALREEIRAALEQARETLAETDGAQETYDEERARLDAAAEALARRWVWDSLDAWLRANEPALLKGLGALRKRHERHWFYRVQVHRVVIVPSSGENRAALVEACRAIYPGFNADQSVVVPFIYEPEDGMAVEERRALEQRLRKAGRPREAIQREVVAALRAENARHLEEYLQVLTNEVGESRADLLVIEHRREVAARVLEHLRQALPHFRRTPAILILPEPWAPPDHEPLPWPRTRVVLLRHMGDLSAADCAKHLKQLYSA